MELQVKNNLRSTNLSPPLYSNCFELRKITTLIYGCRIHAKNVPVPKNPCTVTSTETKCPCAEMSMAEMSMAEMLGAKMVGSQKIYSQVFFRESVKTRPETSGSGQVRFNLTLQFQVRSGLNIFKLFVHSTYNLTTISI